MGSQADLDALAVKYPTFKVCYSLTSPAPEDAEKGFLGMIDKGLMEQHLPVVDDSTFVCW